MPSIVGIRGPECARRRPAWINICEVQRIELRPKNVALGSQSGVGLVLFLTRARVFHYPGQSEIGVFGGLRKASGQIIKTSEEPGIIFPETIHAKRNQFSQE